MDSIPAKRHRKNAGAATAGGHLLRKERVRGGKKSPAAANEKTGFAVIKPKN
jgi:hypothetical protein